LLAGRDGEVAGALKVGVHGQGTVTTAADRDFIPNPVARDQVLQFVRSKIPGLLPDPVGELTCLYTSTASEDFILDRQGPFVVCSPCSGHGAKFAPLVGEIVADLAEGKPPEYPRFTLAAHLSLGTHPAHTSGPISRGAAELPGTFRPQPASLLAGTLLRP
jgi:sarcosine oxidase